MKTPRTIALLLTLCALAATACNRGASQPVTRTESTTSQIQPASLVSDTSTNSGDVATTESPAEPTMLPGPNAVPKDTRIVVNIPAFRMDVFKDGVLVKSYKVG
ncbi:MAG TPA: L,D-transpeptidase, partial [Pyrinomonadaceae bacterium]